MRRAEFEIKDKQIIEDILSTTEYGTFALCKDKQPYSIALNIVYEKNALYFHGAKKGKKKEYIEANSTAALSVVEPYAMIQSYFSSTDGTACPATQFFRSVYAEGTICIVKNNTEKIKALSLLMRKLQPEGKYIPLEDAVYTKMLNATEVFRFDIKKLSGKIKLGQHLETKRFDMILEHLELRGNDIDRKTAKLMREIKV